MKIEVKCETCGKPLYRYQCEIRDRVFCSRQCAKLYLSSKMSKMNAELNPTRMVLDTRTKLRESHLGRGEGKTYTKTYSRHTHRIVAEETLGRPLRKGEVVHHIDGDKRNNHPLNLMVFRTQAEHSTWHLNERFNPSKNYE